MMIQTKNNIWQIEADTEGRGDFDFFITPNEKYCIYFSKIDEYGMMKFVSPVQIWVDKVSPRLLFHPKKTQFEYQYKESCYYLDKSDILILMTPCRHQQVFKLLYVLFDFNRSKFTSIHTPDFHLKELDRNLIQLDILFRYSYNEQVKQQILRDNNTRIDLTQLEWHDIDNIDKVCHL